MPFEAPPKVRTGLLFTGARHPGALAMAGRGGGGGLGFLGRWSCGGGRWRSLGRSRALRADGRGGVFAGRSAEADSVRRMRCPGWTMYLGAAMSLAAASAL